MKQFNKVFNIIIRENNLQSEEKLKAFWTRYFGEGGDYHRGGSPENQIETDSPKWDDIKDLIGIEGEFQTPQGKKRRGPIRSGTPETAPEEERIGSFFDRLRAKYNIKKVHVPYTESTNRVNPDIMDLANLLRSIGNTIENNSDITAVRLIKQMRGSNNDDVIGMVVNKMIKLIQDEKK